MLLIDASGHDRLEGLGANRDTVNAELVVLLYNSTSIHPVVSERDLLTLSIRNNVVSSAEIEITLTYAPGV